MPETGDAERLVVLLEARVNQFEKNMKKAEGAATSSYAAMRRGSRSATAQMEADMVRSTGRINQALAATGTKIGAFGKAFGAGLVGPLAGLLSVTAALNGAKQALSEFDSIGKSAKAAGLTAEQFQELAYAANLGGVSTDQFAKSLETLNRNTGLAAAGKGDLVEKLKVLNPELLKSILAATSQAERVRIAADAIDAAGSASEKAALATALFGDSGTRMVEVLKGGSAALDNTAQKARALGVVISGDLIARAESLNDELSTATRIMDLQFKAVLVDLAPLLISTAELAGGLAIAIRQIVDAFKDMEDRSTATLRDRLETVKALISEGTGPMAGYTTDDTGGIVPSNPMAVTMGGGDVEALQAEQAAIEAILEARKNIANLPPLDLGGGGGGGAGAVTDAMKAKLDALRESLMTEEQLEMDSHTKRLAEIQVFYEQGAILKTEHDSLIEAAQQQHADKMTDIARKQAEEEARIRDQTIGGVASLFGSLSSLIEKTGGENLAAAKAFGVAEAVVNVAQGITKAFTLPPPASWAQAAAVGAAGAAQIATIMSASKGSNNVTNPGGVASAAAPAQPSRSVSVNLYGDTAPMGSVRRLVDQLKEELAVDGLELMISHRQA